MIRERYFAVRVGKPGKHFPYLMVSHECPDSPGLYVTKGQAEQRRPKYPDMKVVRVEVRELKK